MAESVRKTEALLREAALVLEDQVPPQDTTLPTAAGKTPTTSLYEAALTTAVDGGSGDVCIDGMPSQGLHVVSPNAYSLAFSVHLTSPGT